MNVLACLPPASSLEGTPQEKELLAKFLATITSSGEVSAFERDSKNLLFLLRKSKHDLDKACTIHKEWSKWRREKECDSISNEEIAEEIADGICVWRGKDNAGRMVCVVTGRHLKVLSRKGTCRSFEKFLIKIVEDGIRMSNGDAESDRICIVYDRRSMTFDNIDNILSKYCKPTLNSLADFYGNRMGVLYVLHVNWFFKIAVDWVLRPLLGWVGMRENIVFVDDENEMKAKYFDADLFEVVA